MIVLFSHVILPAESSQWGEKSGRVHHFDIFFMFYHSSLEMSTIEDILCVFTKCVISVHLYNQGSSFKIEWIPKDLCVDSIYV